MLTAVLPKPVADATGDGAAVDGDLDLLIGHSPEVRDHGRVELVETELGEPAVPPLEDRLRHRTVGRIYSCAEIADGSIAIS